MKKGRRVAPPTRHACTHVLHSSRLTQTCSVCSKCVSLMHEICSFIVSLDGKDVTGGIFDGKGL
jgi:hypothetical protein